MNIPLREIFSTWHAMSRFSFFLINVQEHSKNDLSNAQRACIEQRATLPCPDSRHDWCILDGCSCHFEGHLQQRANGTSRPAPNCSQWPQKSILHTFKRPRCEPFFRIPERRRWDRFHHQIHCITFSPLRHYPAFSIQCLWIVRQSKGKR